MEKFLLTPLTLWVLRYTSAGFTIHRRIAAKPPVAGIRPAAAIERIIRQTARERIAAWSATQGILAHAQSQHAVAARPHCICSHSVRTAHGPRSV